MKTRAAAVALGLLVLLGISCRASQTNEGAERRAYAWFSMPIEVADLPGSAQFVPVSCHVDFSQIVMGLGAGGVVDEHSLRLVRIDESRETAQPVQFECDPQLRVRAIKKLADTPAGVSYLGEYRG